MKKLVAFAAVIAAVSFASCGNKSAESATENVAETPAVEEAAAPAAEVAAPADSTAACCDSTAVKAEAAPAE